MRDSVHAHVQRMFDMQHNTCDGSWHAIGRSAYQSTWPEDNSIQALQVIAAWDILTAHVEQLYARQAHISHHGHPLMSHFPCIGITGVTNMDLAHAALDDFS